MFCQRIIHILIVFVPYEYKIPPFQFAEIFQCLIQICVYFLPLSYKNQSPSTARERERENRRVLPILSLVIIRHYWNTSFDKMTKNKVLPTQSNHVHIARSQDGNYDILHGQMWNKSVPDKRLSEEVPSFSTKRSTIDCSNNETRISSNTQSQSDRKLVVVHHRSMRSTKPFRICYRCYTWRCLLSLSAIYCIGCLAIIALILPNVLLYLMLPILCKLLIWINISIQLQRNNVSHKLLLFQSNAQQTKVTSYNHRSMEIPVVVYLPILNGLITISLASTCTLIRVIAVSTPLPGIIRALWEMVYSMI